MTSSLFKGLHDTTDPQPKLGLSFKVDGLTISVEIHFIYINVFCAGFILHQGQRMKCFDSITSASELTDVI